MVMAGCQVGITLIMNGPFDGAPPGPFVLRFFAPLRKSQERKPAARRWIPAPPPPGGAGGALVPPGGEEGEGRPPWGGGGGRTSPHEGFAFL